jgi:GNAT superfamily N-acetyltransferase
MASSHGWERNISRAPGEDLLPIRGHLLRLDREALYSRFGNVVTNEFLIQYIERAPELDTIIFGCWVNVKVRGIGELRRFALGQGNDAEAAFTVESAFRDLGIGTALTAAVANEAWRIDVRDVYLCFGVRNQRMRRIAQKFHAAVSFDERDCTARLSIKDERARETRSLAWLAKSILPLERSA